jgi:hypothetical protein
MKQIRRLLLIAIVPALAVMLPLAAIAQSSSPPAPDSPETLQEQALALEAERGAHTPLSPISPSQPLAVQYPLFVGVDDVTVPAYQIDPLTNDTIEAFTGAQVWGAAYDVDNNKVYFNQGTTLYEWPVGGAVNTLGTIVDAGANPQSMVGLAFHNGILYGTKNIPNEAVWIININTLVATVYIDYEDADYDFGGLAAHPLTGELYATNDDTTPHGSGLFRINLNGTATLIAPYPDGQADIDGLAISQDGKAYLVTDEPGFIYVYDLVAGSYLTPLNNPWTTSEVFSGATWIREPSPSICNSYPITIPSSGAATPYPSAILIDGYSSLLTDVNIHLLGLSHTWPDDIDILLVGPQGQNLIIMSDAGGSLDVVDINLTFDDAAADLLPDSAQIVSGSYRPTNYGAGDNFPAPAPAPTAATTLATFNNTDPNGTWFLYVVDDTGSDSGQIARGWCLEIQVETPSVAVDPGELSQTQRPNQQQTLPLTIANQGAGAMDWIVHEAEAGMFVPVDATQPAPVIPGSILAPEELTGFSDAGLPDAVATAGLLATPLTGPASAGLIFYGDRAIFDAVFPGLPVEDFEAGLWGDGQAIGCPAPFNAATNNACFTPGGILPGISFQDNPLNNDGGGLPNGLAGVGDGIYGAVTKSIVANQASDSFEILFDPPVNAAGMDLTHFYSNGAVVSISTYDASDVLIASVQAIASNAGNFWGVYSAVPIGRINIYSPLPGADGYEGVDNVAFGQIGACSPAEDLPWASVDPDAGLLAGGGAVDLDVTFDSTGLVPGTVHTGTLCLNSNDPLQPLLEIPLTLTVDHYRLSLPLITKP